ncbi:hypothetical protein FSP39_020146 [Pinctada imbricata]|uniref:Uncharacterized protein n=1 Tax=Pinctada imbricata TaxID=66713 RepID=A0AA88YM15_PINIB|nr:hypothetical protein FSP39_020146 [Pinctada imbricata]
MHVRLDCRPNLGDQKLSDEVKDLWNSEMEDLKKSATQKAIGFLDTQIQTCNEGLKTIRQNALLKLGTETPISGNARTQLNVRMSEKKEQFDKWLLDFRTKIRSDTREMKLKPVTKNT